MNKQELIAAMRNEIYDGNLCKSDLENYDVKDIEKSAEPFLWSVRPTGTTLQFVGTSRMTELFSEERCRMMIFRDRLCPIDCITYDFGYGDKTKFFYWDGLSLFRIQRDEVEEVFLNLWSAEIERQKMLHKDEFDVCTKPLPVHIMCGPQKYEEALNRASELGDSSLKECIERLTLWTRLAVDHKIEIRSDFSKYSFTFCEFVNGEPRLCGGIIYSESASNGQHWSMHT